MATGPKKVKGKLGLLEVGMEIRWASSNIFQGKIMEDEWELNGRMCDDWGQIHWIKASSLPIQSTFPSFLTHILYWVQIGSRFTPIGRLPRDLFAHNWTEERFLGRGMKYSGMVQCF
jgi:hypothetical protein